MSLPIHGVGRPIYHARYSMRIVKEDNPGIGGRSFHALGELMRWLGSRDREVGSEGTHRTPRPFTAAVSWNLQRHPICFFLDQEIGKTACQEYGELSDSVRPPKGELPRSQKLSGFGGILAESGNPGLRAKTPTANDILASRPDALNLKPPAREHKEALHDGLSFCWRQCPSRPALPHLRAAGRLRPVQTSDYLRRGGSPAMPVAQPHRGRSIYSLELGMPSQCREIDHILAVPCARKPLSWLIRWVRGGRSEKGRSLVK
ncbi:hypothetical protein BJ166DRAFT_599140 [Pestalotiopsis sp. NC0098]|nr:hypothetical protein BJ166DRAFT_599140 [Pestalotiopsis sp. NC0098]